MGGASPNAGESGLRALRKKIRQARSPNELAKTRADNQPLLNYLTSSLLASKAPRWSAHQRLNADQKRIIYTCLGIFFLSALVFPFLTAIGVIFFFQLFFLISIALRYCLVQKSILQNQKMADAIYIERDDTRWPCITILVPLYREKAALPSLKKALEKLVYPASKIDLKLLLEEDDIETRRAAETSFDNRQVDFVVIPPGGPRTKPKACNYGLWSAKGLFTVIYDAEDRPEADQLKKAVTAFDRYGPKLACVQARLNYYNRNENWLTRLFAIEYALLFDFLLPGLTALKAPVPLGGTSNFFRTDILLTLGGWDPYNVTEDADLGLRLFRAGHTTTMIDSTTWEEAVPSLSSWLQQRSRWIKGYLQTWLVHMRAPLRWHQPRAILFALVLHFFIGAVFLTALLNPVFMTLLIATATGLMEVTHTLPRALSGIAVFCFLLGNLFHLYLHIAAPIKRRWYGLIFYGFTAPAYWFLQSIAAWMALGEFISRPFYWAKTDHFTRRKAIIAPQVDGPVDEPVFKRASKPAHKTPLETCK